MTETSNGKDSVRGSEGGLVGGTATIGVALLDAAERIACRTIEASTRIAEAWLRSVHSLASELIEKTAESIQQILEASRETAERALEAAGSTVEGAGRFGERTAASVTEAISLAADSRSAAPGNGAASGRFFRAGDAPESSAASAA